MFCIVCAVGAVLLTSMVKPVCLQDGFCQSVNNPDCHRQPSPHILQTDLNRSSDTHMLHDLDNFEVSCKKLIALGLDEVPGNFVRTVKNCIFSKSLPTPLKGPLRLAAISEDVIENILDLEVASTQSDDFLHYASGGRLLPGSVPLAHRYGGHQFGYWAGQLGDGRAHLLGQHTNRKGEIWELQLKGSGKTPYSRSGDGRAVIRSSVREFLGSEAMHSLGIPTSRAASLIVSDEPVLRDPFYNGNVKKERGAVVLRLAKSWFRIGSLEILARSGEPDLLRKLLNFVIEEQFPSISSEDPDKYLVFYHTVLNETAHLIAQWMSVGFAHGVCNTDNFSLLSITIDYGPFGFMDSYDPNFVPNTSDDEGRYSIGAQANVGLFNLERLLEALSPVLTPEQQQGAKQVLKGYGDIYHTRAQQLLKVKLGLLGEEEDDGYLIGFLLKMMEDTRSDFTMTFRQLSEVTVQQLHNTEVTKVLRSENRRATNCVVQQTTMKIGHYNTIKTRQNTFTCQQELWALHDLSSHKLYAEWLGMYAQRLGRQGGDTDEDRQRRMRSVNPRYVLRNWMAESAIRKAEVDDFSEVELLQRILTRPYLTQDSAEKAGYAARPPRWAQRLKVSCSS